MTAIPRKTPFLEGRYVRLEPLTALHLPALEEIAFDSAIWRYMNSVIRTPADLRHWLDTAIGLEATGSGMPWATVLKSRNRVVGSTRFIDLDLHHRTVEIGNTWLAPSSQGGAINTEAKLLQLAYAFEALGLERVAFKTHHANLRSQAAIRAIGATAEGVFRSHYLMPDGSRRHSHWFSIIREDWPQVKSQLELRLAARSQPSA